MFGDVIGIVTLVQGTCNIVPKNTINTENFIRPNNEDWDRLLDTQYECGLYQGFRHKPCKGSKMIIFGTLLKSAASASLTKIGSSLKPKPMPN